MFIKILSTALLLSLVIMQAPAAQSKRQVSKQIKWPKTFSGQPDFVFVKEEVVKAALTKAKDEGAEPPKSATLDDLLGNSKAYTPLNLNKINPTAETVEENAPILTQDQPTAQNVLPTVLEDALLDVSEFKIVLQNAAKNAVRKARVNMQKYNFRGDLARLILQAVVTSPNKYAVINGRRYKKGDRLHITVPVQVDAADILKALNAHMPPKGALAPERYKQYENVREEVMKSFKQAQEEGKINRTQRISIKIKDIQSRKVILSTGGQNYDLEIKFRL